RSTLTSIITATLTVTATVFGFLIVALQVASTQFSPRSLREFVRDRTTQTSLAVLLGVVAYAIGVLVVVGDGRTDAPGLAVTLAVLLVLLVVATLALLIDHTAQSIRIEHLMRSITEDTLRTLATIDAQPEPHGHLVDQVPATPDGAV